jgi:RimJ/RimL family protein N-acetyltransferase
MLAGKRVVLRAAADADEDVLYRLWSELASWEERASDAPTAVTRSAFRAKLAYGDLDGDADFVIEADGAAIGRCTLFGEDSLARTAEVGVALLSDSRGHGYGSEALELLVEFAFVRRNLRRLHVSLLATNTAAITSYRKLGFADEGRRREHRWVRGRYEDELAMGLLRAEWAQRR